MRASFVAIAIASACGGAPNTAPLPAAKKQSSLPPMEPACEEEHRSNVCDRRSDKRFECRCHHPNGLVSTRWYVESGELDGVYRSYRENGTLASTEHWRRGKRHGVTEQFSKTGAISHRTTYDTGVPVSASVWALDGGLHQVTEFRDGVAVTTVEYSAGKVYRESVLAGDVVHDKVYYSHGTLKRERTFQVQLTPGFDGGTLATRGASRGTHREYRPDGRLEWEEQWRDDRVVSRADYDARGTLVKTLRADVSPMVVEKHEPTGRVVEHIDDAGNVLRRWRYDKAGTLVEEWP